VELASLTAARAPSPGLDTIPGPLRDRMEIIEVSGYTAADKEKIAKNHLLPKACDEAGLKASHASVSDAALRVLINKYCREPGVRNLQKQIEKLLRKIAFRVATNKSAKKEKSKAKAAKDGAAKEAASTADKVIEVNELNLEEFVGAPVFPKDRIYDSTPAGVVMGLAWTSMGGMTLYIECVSSAPSEKAALRCTGQVRRPSPARHGPRAAPRSECRARRARRRRWGT